MRDVELFKRWKVTETLLRKASGFFRNPPKIKQDFEFQLKAFNEALSHNELELAMDALQKLGEMVVCPGGFWRDLERAALSMNLTDRANYFRSRFLSSRPKNSNANDDL